MVVSLFRHERVKTTVRKAKEARRLAEKMITLAKKNTLHTRRLAFKKIKDNEVLAKLFSILGPRYANRNGGYTRIIRLSPRTGDGAELAILELMDRIIPESERKKAAKAKRKKPKEVRKAEEIEEPEYEEIEEPEEQEVPADVKTSEPEKQETEKK